MGEPIQKINSLLSSDVYYFEFSYHKNGYNYYYNVSDSTSFINITDKNKSYPTEVTGKETFYFYTDVNYKNKIKIQNLTISLLEGFHKTSFTYNFGIIGLRISYPTGPINNFIIEIGNLKQKLNFINGYEWQIKNINKDNYELWQLIIGEYPHEYDSKNFKEESLKYTLSTNNIEWKMTFHEIKSGNISLGNEKEVAFKFSNIHMIAPDEYRLIILENFFNEYINQSICFEEKLNLRFIYCNKNLFTINDIKKFPKLNFYEINLNYTFELNLNDLFIEKGEYYWFLVGFGVVNWSFGLSFLKKYPLIFNHENKAIYYYIDNIVKNENKSNDKGIYLTANVSLIIGIVIAAVFLIIGFFAGKNLFNERRKKKANELDDDYDYKQQNENNLNNEGLGVN